MQISIKPILQHLISVTGGSRKASGRSCFRAPVSLNYLEQGVKDVNSDGRYQSFNSLQSINYHIQNSSAPSYITCYLLYHVLER